MTTDSTLHPPRSPHAPATIPSKALRTYLTPLLILFGIVIASGAQTEVAHNLTSSLGYNQPYFTFYLTHVTFSLIFPVHLLLLYLLRPVPISRYIDGLRHVIADQLGEPDGTPWRVIAKRWSWKVTWLTCLVTVPALAWFAAMVYSPAMDITAIYATSSFHAYFFSMLLLKQPLSRTTAGSIALAFAGVIVLSLAGTEGGGEDDQAGGSNRFFGDIVMMGGAVVLGLYEVVYKMALPEAHGGIPTQPSLPSGYSALPTHVEAEYEFTPPDSRSDTPQPPHLDGPLAHSRSRGAYPVARTPNDTIPLSPTLPPHDRGTSDAPLPPSDSAGPNTHPVSHHQPQLPAALHANFLTSCIGVATLLLLWVPIVLLDWTGIEPFRWPGSGSESVWGIWAGLEVVAWGGAFYNAGLMVLIGIWGPTTSSVANLLTIGLVAVIDAVLMGHLPGVQTLVGVGMICIGFGVLLWEGEA